jgi:hypothetical protein
MVTAMDDERFRLGSAQARFNDYAGTAAADDADAVLNSRSLYEIAGLDRERWTIVAIDFSLASTSETVVVYAADRGDSDSDRAETAELIVTAFQLAPSVRLGQFLHEAFQRISVRLLSGALGDRQLVVAGRRQLTSSE